MIRVKNKKVIQKLSKKSLKANRLRNRVAIAAIALTAMMFTALFTVSGSLVTSFQRATMRQVGTEAHAGFKFLSEGQYEILKKDPKIRDISYNIVVGIAQNKELQKTYTEIRYTEEKAAKWSFCTPTTGRLPEKKYELATGTQVLDALGIPHELGQKVHLEFRCNGVDYAQDFTLCGFWDTDIVMGANEAFVSRTYCNEVAPVIQTPIYENPDAEDLYAGTINPSLWFSSSFDIDHQVDTLMERCGFDKQKVNSGVNWAYATATVDATTILLIIGVLTLVLFSGYLIIYNIFYISVSKDIRFYGLLKTIGTTGKQLSRIVKRQAMLLCSIGIPLGLLLGYLVGRLVMPAVINSTTLSGEEYVVTANPWIFVGAAVFALLTVLISCIKPCRAAAKVSPVEAVRFCGVNENGKWKQKRTKKVSPFSMARAGLRRDRKKAVTVVISITLSLILLNGTYTMVKGFDMDKFLAESIVTDFSVMDVSLKNLYSGGVDLQGITPTFQEAIKELPGLQSVGNVYMRESKHHLSKEAYENAMNVIAKYQEELPMPYAEENIRMAKEDGDMFSYTTGLDEMLWDKLELANDVKLDSKLFSSGDYVIAGAFWTNGKGRYYEPGDTVTIDFENGNTKDYTVLAIGTLPYPLSSPYSNYLGVDFVLPSSEYLKQMGEVPPMMTTFNVEQDKVKAAEEWIENYSTNVEPNLTYVSKDTYVKQFKDNNTMFAVIGGALSIILGLIGILNFANAIVTSIHSRRRELAMLKSVGMTGRQLKEMLIWEGGLYILYTIIATVTAGSLLCWGGVKLLSDQMWFFTYHFTLLPVLISIPALILIAVAVPYISCRLMEKQSVVERLREAE